MCLAACSPSAGLRLPEPVLLGGGYWYCECCVLQLLLGDRRFNSSGWCARGPGQREFRTNGDGLLEHGASSESEVLIEIILSLLRRADMFGLW